MGSYDQVMAKNIGGWKKREQLPDTFPLTWGFPTLDHQLCPPGGWPLHLCPADHPNGLAGQRMSTAGVSTDSTSTRMGFFPSISRFCETSWCHRYGLAGNWQNGSRCHGCLRHLPMLFPWAVWIHLSLLPSCNGTPLNWFWFSDEVTWILGWTA